MIEIVGFSTKLPGASSEREFWELLQNGKCSVTEIPDDRWSKFHFYHPRVKEPGKSYTFAAGVLDDIFGFDPVAFGISPREAEQMDPQQRLMLQTTYEAIENAGISPQMIAGEEVGVFIGASGLDYSNLAFFDVSTVGSHFMTGNTLSILANRVSYIFDFRGPSFVVDTACSSSLVALREAVSALETGRIETAIVAGVNALLNPVPFVGFSNATMLSPDGLCRAFDADGKGYVRAEGCVSMVLRRSDASPWKGQRSRADLVAVDVNSDGRTVGMSLPSAFEQATLLRRVYAQSGVDPDKLAFLEAHGTGTRVGDPAEAQSIGEVLASKRKKPLLIGSVKTNIGHLEPASGLAGMVKAALALENDFVPASLHFETPNPDIDFQGLNIEVVSKGRNLGPTAEPRFAGVNSFGFGGTNAHVILSDPARTAKSSGGQNKAGTNNLLMLSAMSQEALKQTAKAYCETMTEEAGQAVSFDKFAAAAFHRKRTLREKLVIQAQDHEQCIRALKAFIEDKTAERTAHGASDAFSGKCAFVFSGNGAQWPGMARDIYLHNATFKASFDELSEEFKNYSQTSLKDLLFDEDLDEQLKLTSISQPLIFSIQVALFDALRERGFKADVVFGHSIGEAAAAVCAEKLTREEGVRLVYHRSSSQEVVAGRGTMAAVLATAEVAQQNLESSGYSNIEIAAYNSHKSLTISGPHAEIKAFGSFARKNHLAMRAMDLNYPFHSALIDDVEVSFRASVGQVKCRSSAIEMISTVSAEIVDGSDLDTDYWWQNLRQPVHFASAVRKASESGVTSFVEIGPKPILQSYVKQELGGLDAKGSVIGTLNNRIKYDQKDPVQAIVMEALITGIPIEPDIIFGDNPDITLPLPFYPWQNKRFRFSETGEAYGDLLQKVADPLLGWRLDRNATSWITHIDAHVLPFLADHVVNGQVIFPGAGYLNIALSVARDVYGDEPVEIQTMDIVSPLRLEADTMSEVVTNFDSETGNIEISSRRRGTQDGWLLHARGRVFKAIRPAASKYQQHQMLSDTVASGAEIYQSARKFGLDYGPAFQRAKLVSKLDAKTLKVQLSPLANAHHGEITFSFHPAELDGCFAGLICLYDMIEGVDLEGRAFVPVYFERIEQYKAATSPETVIIQVRKVSQHSILADFEIFDAKGHLILRMQGARFRATQFDLMANDTDLVLHMGEKRLVPVDAKPDGLPATITPFQLLEALQERKEFQLDGEESESELLLEAAAQRTAFDLMRALSDKDGTVRLEHLPKQDQAYWSRLADLVLQTGEAEAVDGGWIKIPDEIDLPEFDLLLGSILEENPEQAALATLLNLTRSRAFERLKKGGDGEPVAPSGALSEHVQFDTPQAKCRLEVMKVWLETFLQAWPSNRPLRILDLAGSNLGLAHHLLSKGLAGHVDITILEVSSAGAARMSVGVDKAMPITVLDGSKSIPDVLGNQTFDLIVSTGRLHMLSNPQNGLSELRSYLSAEGQLLAVEPGLNLFSDVANGLSEGWFSQSLSAALPIGRLKSSEEWGKTVAEAGFVSSEARDVFVDGLSLSLLRAERGVVDAEVNTKEHELSQTSWIVFAAQSNHEVALARSMEKQLTEKGADVQLCLAGVDGFDPENPDFWRQAIGNAKAPPTLVQICAAQAEGEDPLHAILTPAMTMISAIKAADDQKLRMVLVFGRGEKTALSRENLGGLETALWSFARVLRNEASNVDIVSLTVDCEDPGGATAKLLTALDQKDREIITTAETANALRVKRNGPISETRSADIVRLSFDFPGSLDGLKWCEIEEKPLEAHEVRVQVAASGVNFRDVMWALGMLPEEALEEGYGGASLGLECSGHVSEIGNAVTNVSVGDPVVAFTSHGFGNRVCVPDYAVARISEEMDILAAATLPVAFLTAYYSLIQLGELKPGQWLLLHGAAGGVGLAALQIAKWRGAKVIATAGSDEKRSLLTVMGADHVLNSRSLDFVDEVRSITGDGVHAVLNSLAGEAMERGIQVLRPFGRFLELGKRDFYGNTKIGLRPFRKNISYFGIDVDQLLSHVPDLAGEVMKELFSLIREGVFAPLPYRLFEGTKVQDAFRLMQRSGQIGKILVTPPKAGEIRVPVQKEPFKVSETGAHIVIGGLGGFGGEITKWLADHGAGTIFLTGRSGLVGKEHRALIHDLSKRGVDVRPVACDVSDRKQLEDLLNDIREEMPIKGVIHSAMVIDDGLMSDLTRERFEAVLAPKVTGAKNLTQLTWQDDLDLFLLFSSATTMIGNPGQASYVAANGYLEGMARERRSIGRPALAVGWGAIGDVGFLARNKEISDKLGRHLGDAMISARKGLDLLTKAMEQDDGSIAGAVVYIGKFDWAQAHQSLSILKTPLFEDIVADVRSSKAENQIDLANLVSGKPAAEAQAIVGNLITTEIAKILRLPVEDIGLKRPLPDLGMDSLMGLELRMVVEKRFGLEVPLTALSGESTVDAIAQQILKMVTSENDRDEEIGDRSAIDLAMKHLGNEEGVDEFAKQVSRKINRI